MNRQHSGAQRGDWAKLFFSVGRGPVSGTVAIQGYNFTDGTWSNPEAQFGIAQAWVEVQSDLGYENIRFDTKVGSFWGACGTAGKYDASRSSTHTAGGNPAGA